MSDAPAKSVTIRDLQSIEDLEQAEAVEKEVWGLADRDVMPLALMIATKEAGSVWVGAFDGVKLAGFAFGFLAMESGHLTLHSHMLAVREPYRDLDLGYKLKLAQRERALALRVSEMTWTYDPLQSRNAHLNFGKLGVVSETYKIDFYGPETSSVLHQNGTDRLWVRWPLASRRVRDRLQGKDYRPEVLDIFSRLQPLVQFNGDGKPLRNDLLGCAGSPANRNPDSQRYRSRRAKRSRPGPRMEGRHKVGFHRSPARWFLCRRVRAHHKGQARPRQLPAGEGKRRRLRPRTAKKVRQPWLSVCAGCVGTGL